MDVYKDIGVIIKQKCFHAKRKGQTKYINKYGFGTFCGDVPVFRVNPTTGQAEVAVNTRGRAYAARNRLKYRKTKQEKRNGYQESA